MRPLASLLSQPPSPTFRYAASDDQPVYGPSATSTSTSGAMRQVYSADAWGERWHSTTGRSLSILNEYNQLYQTRGYKSYKKSLKPLNTTASWKAAAPFIPKKTLDPNSKAQESRKEQGPIVDSCIPPVPTAPKPEEYRKSGRVTGPYRLELQPIFAAVEIAGTQFKVTVDDVIFVNQLHGCDVNDVLDLDRVMLLGSRGKTVIGRPYVPDASVMVAVEEHFRDGKVHIFKKRRRKRHRVYKTARSHLMTLRVLAIRSKDLDTLKTAQGLPIQWETEETDVSLT